MTPVVKKTEPKPKQKNVTKETAPVKKSGADELPGHVKGKEETAGTPARSAKAAASFGVPVQAKPSVAASASEHPTATGKLLVECEGLQKAFVLDGGAVYPVLKGIDLEIREGEFVALMGPSGSGKSTLLNILGAMIPATKGKIRINGKDITRMDHNELAQVRRHDVGWIFQDFNLVDNLTAVENVVIPMNLAGNCTDDCTDKARKLLGKVGMVDRADHFPDNMSGGQQQRVAIARALANDPKIFLADEPTGNLDSRTAMEIILLFKGLAAEGKAILMVTHDTELARAAQKVYVIRNGKLAERIGSNGGGNHDGETMTAIEATPKGDGKPKDEGEPNGDGKAVAAGDAESSNSPNSPNDPKGGRK